MPLLLRHLPSPAGRTSRCSLDGQRAMMGLRRAIHRSRTPEPYRASVWDESGVFCVDKRLWKNGNHFSTAFFMTYSDGKLPAMRPLEVERATKWRGGAVRQEPQMTTPPRQAAVCRSGHPLRFISTRSLVHPFAAARHFSTGKHVTGFAARFAPL